MGRNIGIVRCWRHDHLAAEFTVRFSPQESGPKGPSPRNKRTEREKNRGKLEKTAEGVNNSCRQYDFFM